MTPADQLVRAARGSAPVRLPPLESGDRLTRAEFEARYEAMPEGVKGELIDGVVYMASPTTSPHAGAHALVVLWLGSYAAATPGCEVADNGTLRLDELDEPQPDALLRIVSGGLSHVDRDRYLAGSVELVVEIAASSASYDLHQKKACYFRHGVLEYVVVVVHSREVLWFAREESGYVPLPEDKRGVLRSRAFPGLALDTRALLSGDGARLLSVLGRGLATRAHAAFARALARRVRKRSRRRS